jgi:hypothetical protein
LSPMLRISKKQSSSILRASYPTSWSDCTKRQQCD